MTDFIPTDCPTAITPNRMQVHSIVQETPRRLELEAN